MRNLTIGVLLIAGGTAAALPFRRYQSIQDASLEPTQATGPTQSALGNIDLEMLVRQAQTPIDVQSLALQPTQPRWPLPGEVSRTLKTPQQYDAVVVPVDLSANDQAFNATESKGENAIVDSTVSGHAANKNIDAVRSGLQANHVVKPLMNSFSINKNPSPNRPTYHNWDEPASILIAIGDDPAKEVAPSKKSPIEKSPRHPTATAVLASSSQDIEHKPRRKNLAVNEPAEARLPAARPTDQRKHFWIRQPK